jgi:drug/metabolite transporter (DMT)-like permease
MRQKLAAIVVFLVAMAWQYRNNRAVFFVVVGTLFAAVAMLAGDRLPDRVVQSLGLAWAACMLVAGVSALSELARRLKKKKGNAVIHAGGEHKN